VTVTAEIEAGQLAELVKQVQAGHEVLIVEGDRLVARLVPAVEGSAAMGTSLHIPIFKGRQVLTPVISGADIAEDMFGPP